MIDESFPLDKEGTLTKDELIKKIIKETNMEESTGNEKQNTTAKESMATDSNDAACSALLLPEEIEFGWIREYVYNKELTLKSVKDYAKLNSSEHDYEEGRKIFKTNRVRNVEFNNITANIGYCFLRGVIFPCKRKEMAENVDDDEENVKLSQRVWICMDSKTSEILTAGCQCVAHYSNACCHVFALLHFITTIVSMRSRASKKDSSTAHGSKRRTKARKSIMAAACNTSEDENNENMVHGNQQRWREDKKLIRGEQEDRLCLHVDTKGEHCVII